MTEKEIKARVRDIVSDTYLDAMERVDYETFADLEDRILKLIQGVQNGEQSS